MTTPDHSASVLALLRRIQWHGPYSSISYTCPSCMSHEQTGHLSTCSLATTIRALEAQEAAPPPATAQRWRHKKRGTIYREVGRATLQNSADAPLRNGDRLVIYEGDQLWARAVSEFEDGRFERLPATPQPSPVTAAAPDRASGVTMPKWVAVMGVWGPASEAPAGKLLITFRLGENCIAVASMRRWPDGEDDEWIAPDGRTTVTHHSYAAPTHYLKNWPTPTPAGSWDVEAENRALREALKPFAEIKPSSFYPEDGSEAEQYIVILKGGASNDIEFTGEDLARARAVLAASGADDEGGRG